MRAIYIFAFSWLISLTALFLERLAGIEWSFHPDAVTYVSEYESYTSSFLNIPNNLYFFISKWLSGSHTLLIVINTFAYALTNVIGGAYISHYGKKSNFSNKRIFVIFLVFLLQPYRLHLSVHVLKDTLIILMLILSITWGLGRAWAAFVLLLSLRLSAIIYFVGLLPRFVTICILCIFTIIVLAQHQEILEFIVIRNEVDMGGRNFQTLSNFSEYGLKGVLLRVVLWPILLVSGLFWLISPAFALFPVALEMFISRLILARIAKLGLKWVPILASLAIIATLVNSYTAYIRYAYPIVCLLPLIALRFKAKQNEK